MGDEQREAAETGDTSYAPNYDVPEDASPFVPLPLLALCTACREPFPPLQTMSVVVGNAVRQGLCPTCADAARPETEKAQVEDFACTLDAEIAESIKDPEYAAAWRRIEIREATWGLDKRQARRARRRMSFPPGNTRGGSDG